MKLEWQDIGISNIKTKKLLKTSVIEHDISQGFDFFLTEATKQLEDFEFFNTHMSCFDFVFVEGFDKRIEGFIKNKEDLNISFKFEIDFGRFGIDEEEELSSILYETELKNILYQVEATLKKAIAFAIEGEHKVDIEFKKLTGGELI